jgi:hypothetical protein
MIRTDELLEALPEVGLKLWMLDQTGEGWHAAVYDPLNPLTSRQEGEGATPAEALTNALKAAGVNVEDT